jgi:nucleotide-binding universal stress UspA family protein
MNRPLFHRIVVAVNGSQSSIHAAMYGIIMSKTYHLDLKIIYVVDTATIKQLTLSKFFAADEREAYEANLTSDGERYLAYIGDLAKSKGVTAELELRKGAVWSEIITVADDYKADLILLGGKESSEPYYSGDADHRDSCSASRREIIAGAHCSVLVVKQKDIEQLFKIS